MEDGSTTGQDRQSLAERTGHAVAGIGLLNVFTFSAQFALAIAIVRRLDRTLYGRYAVVATITIIAVQVMLCGGDNSALRFVPEFVVQGRGRAVRLLAVLLTAQLLVVWAALTALYAFGLDGPLSRVYNRPTAHLLLLALALAPLTAFQGLLQKLLTAAFSVGAQVIAAVAAFAVTFVLVLTWANTPVRIVMALALGYACGDVLLLAGLRLAWSRLPAEGGALPIRRVMRYSVSSMWTTLLNLIVTRQTETVILGAFAATTIVASYNVAYAMPGRVLEFIPAVLYSVGVASVAEAFTVDRTSLPRAIDLYYRALFIVTAPVAVVGAALGGVLTVTLFGAAYKGASPICQTFFALIPLMLLSAPYVLVVRALEKVWLMTCVLAVEAAVNVGLDLVFIPRWGMWGAVAAVAITFTICVAINLTVYGRLDRTVRPPWRAILRYFAASAPLALLVLPTFWLAAPVALVLGLVLAVPLWLVSARLLRLCGPAEQPMIAALPLPSPAARAIRRVFGL